MSDASSESELSSMQIQVVEESSDDPASGEDQRPKLKHSGVVCQILVDPDASSEEEVFGKKK